ncbi:hypothetical protein ACRDNQ_07445 [Palleronia sp. KMU-117]|uniref:hypothetical protein n=1 Tax=Palleronia sp. KMU-117 TaxID=3434108 RepID=UPI003D724B72
MRPPVPRELGQIAQAALDGELLELRKITMEEGRIIAEIARLRRERVRQEALGQGIDPAAAARLPPWIAWCDARIAAHQRELASFRAAREMRLASVRRAFGRKVALDRLIGAQGRRRTPMGHPG